MAVLRDKPNSPLESRSRQHSKESRSDKRLGFQSSGAEVLVVLDNHFVKAFDPSHRLRRDAAYKKVLERWADAQTQHRAVFRAAVSLRQTREQHVARLHGTRSSSEYSGSERP